MSVLAGATNTTILNNGNLTAVSNTVANIGVQNDIVALLHAHSATAGLLDAKERFDAPKCDEGTRTSMILGMKKFVQDGDVASSPALYWLHGPAGVGKSALAQSLSLSLRDEGDHGASFFFSRTSPGRNDGNRLIVTLAYQLAMNFPALQRFMSKVVRTNPGVFSASNAVQMKTLIIDPINKWHKKYAWSIQRWADRFMNVKPHPRLVLVDGLDECNDAKVQTDLILCIGSAVRQLSIPLRFVITSRPESHILATFELDPAFEGLHGTVRKRNLGDDEDAEEQITTFLLKEFAEIRRTHPVRNFLPQQWPHPDQIRQLVSKSSKGFIYPATVIRYIKMPHNRPDECLERILGLSEIPMSDKPYEPLDFLYRHIFASVPEVNKSSIYNIFHFLVLPSTWEGVTRDPTVIERHFDYPPGHVQHVLRDLLCLVEFNTDGNIKVLHASLPDFLLDKSRSGPLCIDVADAHATIAASYLLSNWRSDQVPTRHGFPDFLNHMKEANMSNTLLNHRIFQMGLLPRYISVCNPKRKLQFGIHSPSHLTSIEKRSSQPGVQERPSDKVVEGVAFLVAYLLVLVMRCGPQDYINSQVTAIKAYIHEKYPLAASIYGLHGIAGTIPTLTLLFQKWKSTIYHESIIRIFECEVDFLQNEIRETTFELFFLMMAYLHRNAVQSSSYVIDYNELGRRMEEQPDPHYWADIIVGQSRSFDTPLLPE